MPPPRIQAAGQKRKATTAPSSGARKRQKAQDARAIPVQSADAALSTSGELNVAAFIKAREFEISALDRSMQKSKNGLMARAFQQVPRDMRRRTASHNVKKVPRRLRRRADREMKEDNTPIITARRRTPSRRLRLRLETARAVQVFNKKAKSVRQKKKEAKANAKKDEPEDHIPTSRLPRINKNKLIEPPRATSKFKRRQVNKTWLPTHLWHAKRAHMTRPTEPLWRMAIPISPTEKSYRSSHRAGASRGCIAWDMSYMSTIGCHGVEASLEGMLKAIGFAGEGWAGAKWKRWKTGTRSADGWASERDNEKRAIAPVTVIWSTDTEPERKSKEAELCNDVSGRTEGTGRDVTTLKSKSKPKDAGRKLFVRVHPSAFHQLWLELIKVSKTQRPQVLLEDLRFEIGSLELVGPQSTEVLLGILKPSAFPVEKSAVENVWTSLAGLTNPATLPQNAAMSFNVADPCLSHPPKQIVAPGQETVFNDLNELIVSWPPDKTQTAGGIFSHRLRHRAALSMPSQKAIARRKAEAPPGQFPQAMEKDPQIPVSLIVSRSQTISKNGQATWTVLLPWKCVDAVWRSLVYYPLSTGGTPRFGGLDQKHQIAFEQGEPWFPGDFGATEAGQTWERTQSERRFDQWVRRPPSRRIAWDTVQLGNGAKGEHGNGWACDWDFLFGLKSADGCPDRMQKSPRQEGSTDGTLNKQASTSKLLTQRERRAAKAKEQYHEEINVEKGIRRRNTSSPESDTAEMSLIDSEIVSSTKMLHLPGTYAAQLLRARQCSVLPIVPALITVRITLLIRGTPDPAARIYRLPSAQSKASLDLRNQWMELDPTNEQFRQPVVARPKHRTRKDKMNRHGLPRVASSLPIDPLSHINYLPPDAHPDVVAQYGPNAVHEISSPTAEENEKELRKLMFANMTTVERDRHPACPDVGDLLGFVTSGAYNLAEGRGTAVGNLWIQKLVDGWREGDKVRDDTANEKRKDRERRLCIVRNAGEGVGRLGIWELC